MSGDEELITATVVYPLPAGDPIRYAGCEIDEIDAAGYLRIVAKVDSGDRTDSGAQYVAWAPGTYSRAETIRQRATEGFTGAVAGLHDVDEATWSARPEDRAVLADLDAPDSHIRTLVSHVDYVLGTFIVAGPAALTASEFLSRTARPGLAWAGLQGVVATRRLYAGHPSLLVLSVNPAADE